MTELKVTTPDELFSVLDGMGIKTTTYTHEPVFTVEEGVETEKTIPGIHTKNLFLRTNKKKYLMVSMIGKDRLDLKAFTRMLGLSSGGLSFASNERLMEYMGVEPGHVTPFAFINKSSKDVRPILDQAMFNEESINFHPLKNHMTTAISGDDLLRFLAEMGHDPEVMELPKL